MQCCCESALLVFAKNDADAAVRFHVGDRNVTQVFQTLPTGLGEQLFLTDELLGACFSGIMRPSSISFSFGSRSSGSSDG